MILNTRPLAPREVHSREQLAQSCYLVGDRPGVNSRPSSRESHALTTEPPSHLYMNKYKTYLDNEAVFWPKVIRHNEKLMG